MPHISGIESASNRRSDEWGGKHVVHSLRYLSDEIEKAAMLSRYHVEVTDVVQIKIEGEEIRAHHIRDGNVVASLQPVFIQHRAFSASERAHQFCAVVCL